MNPFQLLGGASPYSAVRRRQGTLREVPVSPLRRATPPMGTGREIGPDVPLAPTPPVAPISYGFGGAIPAQGPQDTESMIAAAMERIIRSESLQANQPKTTPATATPAEKPAVAVIQPDRPLLDVTHSLPNTMPNTQAAVGAIRDINAQMRAANALADQPHIESAYGFTKGEFGPATAIIDQALARARSPMESQLDRTGLGARAARLAPLPQSAGPAPLSAEETARLGELTSVLNSQAEPISLMRGSPAQPVGDGNSMPMATRTTPALGFSGDLQSQPWYDQMIEARRLAARTGEDAGLPAMVDTSRSPEEAQAARRAAWAAASDRRDKMDAEAAPRWEAHRARVMGLSPQEAIMQKLLLGGGTGPSGMGGMGGMNPIQMMATMGPDAFQAAMGAQNQAAQFELARQRMLQDAEQAKADRESRERIASIDNVPWEARLATSMLEGLTQNPSISPSEYMPSIRSQIQGFRGIMGNQAGGDANPSAAITAPPAGGLATPAPEGAAPTPAGAPQLSDAEIMARGDAERRAAPIIESSDEPYVALTRLDPAEVARAPEVYLRALVAKFGKPQVIAALSPGFFADAETRQHLSALAKALGLSSRLPGYRQDPMQSVNPASGMPFVGTALGVQ